MIEIRIIVLGDYGVGKTSLLRKLKNKVFEEHLPCSVGFDFFSIRKQKNGYDLNIQFWDTAGQQRFATITSQYFQKADAAAIIVSAQSSHQSKLEQFKKYLKLFRQHSSNKPCALIITKRDISKNKDRNQQIDFNGELNKLEQIYKCGLPSVLSAKTSEPIEIEKVFQNNLVNKILQTSGKFTQSMISAPSHVILGSHVQIKQQSNCCSE